MENSKKRIKFLMGMVVVFFALSCRGESTVWVVDIEGGIGPATVDHISRGLEDAMENKAQCVVLRINTPGGLDSSTRDIISLLLASPLPVLVYVAPSGARAASAGTYILYASHIAAMAPATTVGAATPVQLGAPSIPAISDKDKDLKPQSDKTVMQRKIINDAVAYIVGLAELRGRNVDWAKKAVLDADSITAKEAYQTAVIDILADDLKDLLQKVHGTEVKIFDNKLTLNTENANLYYFQSDWRNKFLLVITDPSLAYILLLIGVYGLMLEFSHPGLGAGIIGTICLLIALYAFQLLPINYTGLALIILGLALMVAEAFAPSFGVLGIGGIVAFVFGSIALMDTTLAAYQIALPLIIAFALFSAVLLTVVISLLARVRHRAPVSGLSSVIGNNVRIENIYNDEPKIRINGELWQVFCEEPLLINDLVTIVSAKGIVLEVKKTSINNEEGKSNGN